MPKYMYILYAEERQENGEDVLLEDPIPFSSWKKIHEYVNSLEVNPSVLHQLLRYNNVPLAKYTVEDDEYKKLTITVIRKLINPVEIKKNSLIEYLCSFTKEFPVWKEAEKEVDRLFPDQTGYTTEDLDWLITEGE